MGDHVQPLLDWLILFWPPLLAGMAFVIAVSAGIHALMTKRSAEAAIAWVGLIMLAPVIGTVAYILLGINRIQRKALELKRKRGTFELETQRALKDHICTADHLDSHMSSLAQVGRRLTRSGLLSGNQIELLRDGDQAYPAMLDAIDQATSTITLCTYIFDNDPAGQQFIDALTRAHERGVQVRVLIDTIGTLYSRPRSSTVLAKRGVRVAQFMPLRTISFVNLRTHRKIMVVDGKLGFTGGMNIRHSHVLGDDPHEPTHDTHFRIRGPLVYQLQRQFAEDWHFTTGESLTDSAFFPPPEVAPGSNVTARAISDGPDEHYEHLQWLKLAALSTATDRVIIITPYFLPEESILAALQVTAMRGVRVDIILPRRSNLFFVDWASRPNWGALLTNKVNIWLCDPPFDHSKLMIVDDKWSLFGSANWDPRSLRLNFEFNVEAYDTDLAKQLLELAESKLAKSKLVTLEDYEKLPPIERLRDAIFRLGTPYL